ncbi:MAG: hypothetical protein V7726_20245, partial [Pseudoalteromonas distincta]
MIKKILITFSLLYLAAIWQAYILQYLPVYIPIYVPGYISVLSAITFLMYAWDKRQAKRERLANYTYVLKFQGNKLSISGSGWH